MRYDVAVALDDETRPTQSLRCVMLVDVPVDLERFIARALGMSILRVNHAHAACQRMPTTLPLVVVVGGERTAEEVALLEEHTLAIGAQLVQLAQVKELDKLELHLKAAARAADLS